MKAMFRIASLFASVSLLIAATTALAGSASASANSRFQATFVDIYSQCPTSPPVVFCGDGNIAGVGGATSMVTLTGIAPIPGSDCLQLSAVRTITLDSGTGSLTLDETGTRCPPSAPAGSNAVGGPFTVAKTYDIASGTGVFSGATGNGTDINRSAGNSQVSVVSGTLDEP